MTARGSFLLVHFVAFVAVSVLSAGVVQAPVARVEPGLVVVTGQFGTLGASRKLDIVQPMQRLCGSSSTECTVFCSETSFGLYQLGRHPICRVTYRCPDRSTRSVEAAKEEPILLRCGDPDDEPQRPMAATETLNPPPYVPPATRN